MIYKSKAPFRLGLAGGGTDVSPYSEIYGGRIVNACISLYAHVSIKPIAGDKIIFRSGDQAIEEQFDWAIQLPIDGKFNLLKGVYNRVQKDHGLHHKGLLITTSCDAPAGSGLGTSSTLVVAIIGAFMEMLPLSMNEYDIAHYAYEIEREDLEMAGGKQDQYAATFGGINYMEFTNTGWVTVNQIRVSDNFLNELQTNLILYFTASSRDSSGIINEQVRNVIENNAISIEAMHQLKQQAILMKDALIREELDEIGDILDFGWRQKRLMAHNISNERIEQLYAAAKKAGASGGKISGAGGGGFMVFYCPGNSRKNVIAALEEFGGAVKEYSFIKQGMQTWTE